MAACATGAHVMLWLADLSEMYEEDWPGKSMFFIEHERYGRNRYVFFASHPSQWWLTAYAVHFANVVLSDISEFMRTGQKGYSFLGHHSALFIIACLWPLAKKYAMPWMEIVAMGNNYGGESGATVTMRHYLRPSLWWRRVGSELSIPNGLDLYTAFWTMRLPRFVINGAYNFAAWHPYHARGAKLFSYCGPKDWSVKQCFLAMFEEHEAMAKYLNADYEITRSIALQLAQIYKQDYSEGPWLTKEERFSLNYLRSRLHYQGQSRL